MNISKAKTEMSLNTGELEALKERTVGDRVKPLSLSGLDNAGLKQLAEQLWKQIIQIETSKYDLDERSKRQEYDVCWRRHCYAKLLSIPPIDITDCSIEEDMTG